ncbi:MAG: hypothetical protein HN576_01185 [Bacteriovoracaceae bacterium]|nr:hypothetical protein [Bacteriovoracaceae bacterium]
MNKLKNLEAIILLIVLGISLNASALDFYTLNYKIKSGDDFASIIKKFVKPDSIINSKSPMIHKTRGDNPQITDWKNLKAGQKIVMSVTSDVIDMKKVEAYLSEEKKLKAKLALEKQATKVKKRIYYSLGSTLGQVKTVRGSKKLTMNLVKLSTGIKYQTKSKYWLTGSISLAKFLSINHSDSDKSASSGIVPEFGFGAGRVFGNTHLSLAYDMINYYFAASSSTTTSLAPVKVHRLALKPFYKVNESVAMFGGAGFLKSFGSESISGFDLTLGSSYFFGKTKQFGISPLLYMSNLSTSASSESDSSTAWLMSFSASF